MFSLRLTFCILPCIVLASAAAGTNRQQPQNEQRSDRLPLYEIVDFGIKDAEPMDVNNNNEVLIRYEKATKYAVWKNGVITRELPELPPSRTNDQYRFINDQGDVYGYIQSWVEDESESGGHDVATVVKITSDGERSDWLLADAQVGIPYYSETEPHQSPFSTQRESLSTLLSRNQSDLDESFKGLARRHNRVTDYRSGERRDTIDEFIISRGAEPAPDSESIFAGEQYVKGALGPLPDREEIIGGEVVQFEITEWVENSVIDLNDQGVILGEHEECIDASDIYGVRCSLKSFFFRDGEIDSLENLLFKEINLQIIRVHQLNNSGYIIADAVRFSRESPRTDHKYLLRPYSKSLGPAYPKYTVYYPPTIPEVITWGTGLSGPDSDDWSHLLPQSVIDEHKLDSHSIIMAVHGQHLFDREFEEPELTWPGGDKHLEYRLLHSGRYTMEKVNGFDDEQWQVFWRALHDRNEIRSSMNQTVLQLDHSDVYIVEVHLGPNTWAGPYGFKLGDLAINWTLPHATNIAETRFIRTLGIGKMVPGWVGAVAVETGLNGEKMLYERVDALFKYDQFYVEIETTSDVVTSDRIPFDLYRSKAGGAASRIDFPSNQLYAVRVFGNRRLFRSPLIRLNNPQGVPGTSIVEGRPVHWVSLDRGDLLAARVMPHDVARQGRMAIAQVYTTPDQVGAFWREAAVEAARIAKIKTTQPIEQMDSPTLYTKVLLQPWTTVDSTPFVRVGGREVELKVEHLAVMLLIRNQFIASMEEALPRMQNMRQKVKENPAWAQSVWAMLKPDAEREGSPLGDMPVLDWDPARHTTVMGRTVPYRNAYDEQWLDKKFGGMWSDRKIWQHEMALFVFNGYVGAAEQALDYARKLDVTDSDAAESLLRLTTLGMRPMIDRLRPNMLHLVEAPSNIGINFRWEYERQARQSVALIEELGDEFLKNEARVDAINSATQLVAAAVAIFMPETLVGQLVSAGLGIGSAAITLTHDLPEFLGREADVRFALGAYLVVGEDRYITANLRRKPGWMLALDIAGGAIDVHAAIVQLRHARSLWIALRSDTAVASAFAEAAPVFVALPPDLQKAALVRLAQLSDMRASGKTLTELETNIIERGTKKLEEIESLGRSRPVRYMDPKAHQDLDPVIMRDGHKAFLAEHRGAAKGSDTAANAATDAKALFGRTLPPPPPQRIPQQQLWHSFDVGDRIGYGGYAQVYEIPLDPRLKEICEELGIDTSRDICALKVYEIGSDGIEDVARARRTEKILADEGIPQLEIIESGEFEGMGYIVQRFLPEPGIYFPGKMMHKDMQEALLEFHKKLARKEIGFTDGYNKNLYFEKPENGPMICGILDQDRVWKIDKSLKESGWDSKSIKQMENVFKGEGIPSLTNCTLSPRADKLLNDGYCPWPDADYLAMKMLEYKGWIRYDAQAREFVSDRLNIELVEKAFPWLNHPNSIDTKFDVPDHLRHLAPDAPPANLPGDGQSFNPLPFPENIRWVVIPMRVAA